MNQSQALAESLGEAKVNVSKKMLNGYLTAVLFTGTDDEGDPLDDNHDISDIAKEAVRKAKLAMTKFMRAAGDAVEQAMDQEGLGEDDIGINVYFGQAGHGAGFFDKVRDKVLLKKLEDAVAKAGYAGSGIVGDDGKVYIE